MRRCEILSGHHAGRTRDPPHKSPLVLTAAACGTGPSGSPWRDCAKGDALRNYCGAADPPAGGNSDAVKAAGINQ